MPEVQPPFGLRSREEELGEIEQTRIQDDRVMRLLALVVDEEIGRKEVCWVHGTDEGNLSKRLSGMPDKDGKIRRPDFRLLRYALAREKRDRLKNLILVEQGPCLPPRRRDDITDGEVRANAEALCRESGPLAETLRMRLFGKRPADVIETPLAAVRGGSR